MRSQSREHLLEFGQRFKTGDVRSVTRGPGVINLVPEEQRVGRSPPAAGQGAALKRSPRHRLPARIVQFDGTVCEGVVERAVKIFFDVVRPVFVKESDDANGRGKQV